MTEQPSTEMTAMSHETIGFCFCGQMHGPVKDWNEHDWAALRTHAPAGALSAQPVSLPTREQIAEAEALITEADGALSVIGDGDWTWQDTMLRRLADHYRATLALLSQTPAEPCSICEGTGKWTEVVRDGVIPRAVLRDCPVHGMSAEPPRIEDMAPGTTFTWDGHRLMRMSATAQYAAVDDGGFLFDANSIDPSTIRDVTPPKGDGRG